MTAKGQGKENIFAHLCSLLSVTGTFGPMARDPDSIVAAMRALWDGTMFDLDPKVVPIHFREDIFSSTKPLRIGYFQELKKFPTCYSVHRAITTAKSQLESLGHEVGTLQKLI